MADTQVGIYADYNKFDDVASTSWYAGYVNFCANAEYIKGYDARTFGPNDPVTGYQALAMILRALGYDKNGEFTGTNWTIQTAAVGEQRGITKNITAGTLNVPATREVVAEILFRAILVPTVNYTPPSVTPLATPPWAIRPSAWRRSPVWWSPTSTLICTTPSL